MSGTMEIIDGVITYSTGNYDIDFTFPTTAGVTFPSGIYTLIAGPGSSANNAIATFNGTSGDTLQDVSNITAVGGILASSTILAIRSGGGQDVFLQVDASSSTSGVNVLDVNGARAVPIKFFDSGPGHYTGLKAGAPSVDTIYTLPVNFPGSTQAFVSNSAGVMSFQALTSGTVTNVSGVTANGFSFSIANPATTPAVTLIAGAITPSSVAATGTVTGSNLSGTNTGDQTITLTGDVTGSGTGSFAATIANLAITNAKIANTTIDLTAKVTGLLPLANLASLQVNKYFYVDGQRTDSYTPDGSFFRPFKTISASISQIITNADNATHAYNIIVMPNAYSETLTFNNALLYNVTFTSVSGGDAAIQNTSVTGLTSTSNNTNLANLIFNGITFNGAVNLTGDINTTNFGSTQILFSGVQFNNSASTLVLNNINNVNFYNCQMQGSGSVLTFTNVAFAYIEGAEGITSSVTLHLVNNNGGNQPSQFSGNYLLLSTTKMYGTLTIDVGSELDSLQSYFGSSSVTTNNGLIHSWATNWGGTLNLNNGSTLRTRGDNFTNNPVLTGSPTVQYQGHFGYSPATSSNWNSVPINLDGALDTLATSGIVKSQSANRVLASPNGSSGVPSIRALVLADLSISSGFLLGRSTAGVGATEQITIGTGLSLSGGTLTSSGSGGTVTSIIAGTNLTGGTITTSGTIALNPVITGLTSIAVGDLSLSGRTIVGGSSGLALISSATGVTDLLLGVSGGGSIRIYSPAGTNIIPLLFQNANSTAFVALQAPSSPDNTIYTLPTTKPVSTQSLVSDSSGVMSFAAGGISFVHVTTSSVSIVPNTLYLIDNGASLVTLTLPATLNPGDIYRIIGFSSGGWKVAQNASQTIYIGNSSTTGGVTGYISSNLPSDSIELVAITTLRVATCVSPVGTINLI